MTGRSALPALASAAKTTWAAGCPPHACCPRRARARTPRQPRGRRSPRAWCDPPCRGRGGAGGCLPGLEERTHLGGAHARHHDADQVGEHRREAGTHLARDPSGSRSRAKAGQLVDRQPRAFRCAERFLFLHGWNGRSGPGARQGRTLPFRRNDGPSSLSERRAAMVSVPYNVSPSGTDCHPWTRCPSRGCACSTYRRSSPARCAARSSATSGPTSIKIEHPVRGDSMRGHGRQQGRRPAVVEGDLAATSAPSPSTSRHRDGAEVFRRLGDTADVVVENFRPGTLERWGIGPDVAARRTTPGWCSCGSPASARPVPTPAAPGFGTLAEAMSGFAHAHREPDGPPTLPAFGLADSICGIAASSATLMALRHRDRTGRGPGRRHEPARADHDRGRPRPDGLPAARRPSSRGTATGPPTTRRATPTGPRDGKWVAVSTSAQRIAERVMELVGHPEVISEPWFATGHGRAEHADLLDAYVGDWIAPAQPGRGDRAPSPRPAPPSRRSTTPRTSSRTRTSARPRCCIEVDDADLGRCCSTT